MAKLSPVDLGAFALTIIGGLNWGLQAFAGMNLVASVGALAPGILDTALYALVTLSSLYLAFWLFKNQKG